MFAAGTTLAHFSVSFAMILLKSTEEPPNTYQHGLERQRHPGSCLRGIVRGHQGGLIVTPLRTVLRRSSSQSRPAAAQLAERATARSIRSEPRIQAVSRRLSLWSSSLAGWLQSTLASRCSDASASEAETAAAPQLLLLDPPRATKTGAALGPQPAVGIPSPAILPKKPDMMRLLAEEFPPR